MALLNRDQIVQAQDILVEDVDVPEWGGTVRVRGMNARERAKTESTFVGTKGAEPVFRVEALKTLKAEVVAQCLIDEKGQQLFALSEVNEIHKKNAGVVFRLYDVIERLSGISKESVERAEGNSVGAQNGNSDSG